MVSGCHLSVAQNGNLSFVPAAEGLDPVNLIQEWADVVLDVRTLVYVLTRQFFNFISVLWKIIKYQ